MKTILTWSRLLTKRLLRKPSFILTLLLIPLFVLFLQRSLHSGDAILQVALFTESSDPSALESTLLAKMTDASNSTVHFYICDSLSELQDDLDNNRAVCGYLFPRNLEQKLEEHAQKNTAIITAYHQASATETRLLDEFVYRMIYEELAYDIVEQHIYEKKKETPTDRLRTLYKHYQQDYTFIRFEYADGSDNQILNQENSNYLLLPIRGICSVLILLAAMTGTIFWYEDHERKLFLWLPQPYKTMVPFLYSLIPAILAGICGIIAIIMTGFARQFLQECICMGLFLLAITAYSMLLRELLPDANSYLAAIPLSVIGSILLCPIFADLTAALPLLKSLRMLSPVSYYLNSIYMVQARWELFIYSVLIFAAAIGIQRLRRSLSLPFTGDKCHFSA